MSLIDAQQWQGDVIETDICIVGSGPAGATLAQALGHLDLNMVMVESGQVADEPFANALNELEIDSNFSYRDRHGARHRQLGGTARRWVGRCIPFSFDAERDRAWGPLASILPTYYARAAALLGAPEADHRGRDANGDVLAFWADRTARFATPPRVTRASLRCFTGLTLTGEAVLDGRRLSAFRFQTRDRRELTIRARRFVLALGTLENSRMLLLLARQFPSNGPEGLGRVGRFMMDHPRIHHGDIEAPAGLAAYEQRIEAGLVRKRGFAGDGASVRVYGNVLRHLGIAEHLLQRLPLTRYQASSVRLIARERGWLRAGGNELRKRGVADAALARFFNRTHNTRFTLMSYCEQRPRIDNRVVLGDSRDALGLPRLRLRNHLHYEELEAVQDFYAQLTQRLASAGCTLRYDPRMLESPACYTDASHPLGGTRYAVNRNEAVLEGDLCVIGLDNLHVTGGSVFPTGGIENPTHLIVALSCYLAGVLATHCGEASL